MTGFAREWQANAKSTEGSYTNAERMRILGQSGNQVFERYYQEMFIVGLQQVSLLRPSQAPSRYPNTGSRNVAGSWTPSTGRMLSHSRATRPFRGGSK